jgi:FixJ family two-component response regulator
MGAVGCLRKPLDVDELVDVVRRTSTRLAASLPTNPATSPTRRTAR